jgi:glycosyltransferase involved in cell wall biosynthesis
LVHEPSLIRKNAIKKLAIITSHPIQYNAPLFRLLSERNHIKVKVFYTWGQSKDEVYDARFGLRRSWDIPLLDGYEHEFVKNTSSRPDSNRFWGIVNPGLISQLKDEQYDAILVYRWSLYSHLRILQSFGGSPQLFFRGDSHLQSKQNWLPELFKKRCLRFVYRKVDKAFYVGQKNKDYYLHAGLINDQLAYAAHAVDNNRFTMNAEAWEMKALNERAALGIQHKAIVFLYAGKFYAVKMLDLLIRSFQQLKGDHYRLLLVGNGEEENLLRGLAKEDKRIIFQPFRNQSDMPWLYRMGDVFVLPSQSETWGLGVNEAMACARAAIVSDACGCAPELIIEGETGRVFRSKDGKDLLEQLKKFTIKAECEEMGKRAVEHIQQFSLEKVAQAIEESVLDGK